MEQDSSPLAVILGTLPWTLAHSWLGFKSNPKEYMQSPAEARNVTASRTFLNNVLLYSPDQKPAADSFRFWLRGLAFKAPPRQVNILCCRGRLRLASLTDWSLLGVGCCPRHTPWLLSL